MNENQKKRHLISDNLYKVLWATKQMLTENISYGTMKGIIKMHEEEILKLKRPKL